MQLILEYLESDLKKNIKVSKSVDQLVSEQYIKKLMKRKEEDELKKNIDGHSKVLKGMFQLDAEQFKQGVNQVSGSNGKLSQESISDEEK